MVERGSVTQSREKGEIGTSLPEALDSGVRSPLTEAITLRCS